MSPSPFDRGRLDRVVGADDCRRNDDWMTKIKEDKKWRWNVNNAIIVDNET
jgi:hypothetical protein